MTHTYAYKPEINEKVLIPTFEEFPIKFLPDVPPELKVFQSGFGLARIHLQLDHLHPNRLGH